MHIKQASAYLAVASSLFGWCIIVGRGRSRRFDAAFIDSRQRHFTIFCLPVVFGKVDFHIQLRKVHGRCEADIERFEIWSLLAFQSKAKRESEDISEFYKLQCRYCPEHTHTHTHAHNQSINHTKLTTLLSRWRSRGRSRNRNHRSIPCRQHHHPSSIHPTRILSKVACQT